MLRIKYKDDIIKFYKEVFIEQSKGYDYESVGWSTKYTQVIRFEVLYNMVSNKNDVILDLGCGVGDMLEFLKDKNHNINNYIGIDINPTYISECLRKYPNNKFIVGEIFDLEGDEKIDYIIGSGIFTLNMDLPEIFSVINYALSITNKGIGFNFLTKDYVGNSPLNGFNPKDFKKFLDNFFDNVELVEGYLDNEDFTIFIKK